MLEFVQPLAAAPAGLCMTAVRAAPGGWAADVSAAGHACRARMRGAVRCVGGALVPGKAAAGLASKTREPGQQSAVLTAASMRQPSAGSMFATKGTLPSDAAGASACTACAIIRAPRHLACRQLCRGVASQGQRLEPGARQCIRSADGLCVRPKAATMGGAWSGRWRSRLVPSTSTHAGNAWFNRGSTGRDRL